jgi:tetraacyldisaccharide 4'-kinase
VGRRRAAAGRLVESQFGPRVHVLDDGFQHLELFRDLDVLCLEASDLQGHPLPAGRLRELPGAARRADLVLVADAHPAQPEAAHVASLLGADRVFGMSRRPVGFFTPDGRGEAPVPRRAVLLAGIAGPERFVHDVSARGVEVAHVAAFSDHHAFTPDELLAVAERAASLKAEAVVTTMKDAVRIPRWTHAVPLVVFRVRVHITDEPRLRARVLEVARRVSAA